MSTPDDKPIITLASLDIPAGGTVIGRVTVPSPTGLSARAVVVEIGWRTSGRGDTDEGIVVTDTVHEGAIPPGGIDVDFAADIPNVPWTYQGELIKIGWFARGRIDRKLARDPKHECTFVVA